MPQASAIRLIVGLNNPGADYAHTRHNAGAWFVTQLASQHNANFSKEKKLVAEAARLQVDPQHDCRLLLPHTFMNCSGQSVRAALNYFNLQPNDMLVVHDELDLPPGSAKFKLGGGHGGHNGLRDIFAQVGTRDFYRLRIGIGKPIHASDTTNYVLKAAGKHDQTLIDDSISQALHALPYALDGNMEKAMLHLHTSTRS